MRALLRSFALCAFVVGLFGFAPAMAQQATQAPDRDKVCTACHNESWPTPVLSIYQTKMGVRGDPRTPSCQDCHGASENHLKSSENQVDIFYGAINPAASHSATWPKAPSSVEARNGACLTCHESRSLPRTNWAGSQHQTNGLACTNCHNVHSPDTKVLNRATQAEVCFGCHREQRADAHKISAHPLVTTAIGSAPKLVCSDCHDPHGSAGPKLLKKNTVNETCFTCHAEKRGPFLWEHQPATEACVNCHNPHGSNITPMLKSRPPFLCDECHDGPHNSRTPYGTAVAGIQGGGVTSPSNNAVGRACMNCHVMVHGSNSPAGALLHR